MYAQLVIPEKDGHPRKIGIAMAMGGWVNDSEIKRPKEQMPFGGWAEATQVSNYFFRRLRKNFRNFGFIAFFNSPCYETPKNAIKKTTETKATFFVISPHDPFRVFELPLLRNAQKTR
jgi:hypothetical protein